MPLYHAYNALTNTRGDSLVGFRVQARFPNGGAIAPIYSDGNGTPISVVSGFENTAVTDDAGNYSFFIEANANYDLEYSTPEGVFVSATRNVPLFVGVPGEPGPPGQGLEDVMLPDGSGLVGFRVASAATTRNVQSKLREQVSAFDYGSKGDATIDEAPNLQALIAASAVNANGVSTKSNVPRGRYNLGTSVKLYNNTGLVGEGPNATRIFGNPAKPCLENLDQNGMIFHNMAGLQLTGGTHGIYVSADTDNITWRDIEIYNPTVAAIEFNGFLQTALLDHVRIAGGPFGIKSNTTIANNVVLVRPDITATETAIYLRGTEDFTVIGGRFEGGGSTTKSTVDVQAARALQFLGGYFEGGSNPLLKARNSKVSFWGTHFTFQQAGVAYTWDIDASSQLHFMGCHSTIPMVVPAGSIVQNCVNITAASTFNSTAVDSDGFGRATVTPVGNYWREANGSVRFHLEIQLNGAGPGFLKVGLPPVAITQSAAIQAFNSTQLKGLGALANKGDGQIYITGANGFPGTTNDLIVIDGLYRV